MKKLTNHTALQCGLVFCIIYDLGFVDFLKEEVGLKTSSIIFKQVQLTYTYSQTLALSSLRNLIKFIVDFIVFVV